MCNSYHKKTGLPEKIRLCLGNGCFIAGTLVTTRSGLKPIEEIVIGDYVLSRNQETGETSYKKVTDTLVRSTQEICTIELENGKIKSTTGHLFMVKDKWWKSAVELIVGDILVTSDGKEQVVKFIKVEEKGYPVTTYNLTVEDNHTFFVGSEKVLTHNTTKMLKDCKYTKDVSERVFEGGSNRNALLRGDSALYSDTRPNGIRKSYISTEGSLVPANIDGIYKGRQVTVTEHILGGYRKGAKGNSPYTSFTFNRDIIAGYGDNVIEIDISGLRKAIQSGEINDVAILSPKQIERLIKNDKIQSDFWKKRALSWTKRDSEYLIRGEIPSRFIKIKK